MHLELNPVIMAGLHHALDVPESEIQEKLNETRRELDAERLEREENERKNFVPYLYCQTERNIPSPIFVCAILGSDRMKFIHLLPNYNDLCYDEQDILRKKLIAEHLQRHTGSIPAFGKITAYTLKRHYDDEEKECEVYDLAGALIPDPAPDQKVIRDGRASLSVKGKDITGILKVMDNYTRH